MRYRDIPSCLIEQICTSISDEQKFKFPDSQKDQLARLRRYYEGLSKTINEIKGLFYCLSGETLSFGAECPPCEPSQPMSHGMALCGGSWTRRVCEALSL
jgi:hypothetical protein